MIVLINPRYQPSFQPPLGLAYVAAYLKKQGYHNVQIIDTTFERLEDRLSLITDPEVFGIYIMTPYYAGAHKTIEFLKKKFSGIPIVAGGPHASVDPEDTLNNLQISICVRGEGEYTFSEVVKAIREGADLSDIKGISYIDTVQKKIVHTPDREPIQNLDDLPFPGRELLPMNYYLRGGTESAFSYRNIRATTMITSRGCPFNCAFCQPTLNRIFGKKVRFRSVNNVIEEIAHLVRDYSIRGIFFLDDTFTFNKDFVLQFCEEVQRKNFNIQFTINSRINTIDEEMLTALKKTGVVTIMYGVESGNQTVLDNIKKKITVEQIRNTIIATKNKGINVYGYFMIGSPEESASTLKDTFSLVRKLPFDEVQFSMATPYAGTYLYDEAQSLNLIEDPTAMKQNGYFSSTVMRSRYLTVKEIKKYHKYFNLFSRYKSIRNLLVKYPSSIPSFLSNKLFPKWLGHN